MVGGGENLMGGLQLHDVLKGGVGCDKIGYLESFEDVGVDDEVWQRVEL